MRTIKEIKLEITNIRHRIQSEDLKTAAKSRLKKQIAFLNFVVLYIETSPDLEYLKLEVKKVEEKINARMIHWHEPDSSRFTKPQVSKMKKSFEKEWEIPKLRDQLKTIRYILK